MSHMLIFYLIDFANVNMRKENPREMTEETQDPARQEDTSSDETPGHPASRPCYPAADLFGEATEIIIELRELEYRLRITSNGRLILTK